MGAWFHLSRNLAELCGSIRYVGRPEDSCAAVGSHHLHTEEQAALVKRAFDGL